MDENKDQDEDKDDRERRTCACCQVRGVECVLQKKANTQTCKACHASKVKCDWGTKKTEESGSNWDAMVIQLMQAQLETLNEIEDHISTMSHNLTIVTRKSIVTVALLKKLMES